MAKPFLIKAQTEIFCSREKLYQGYCPMHVLDNTTFEHSKFLKWAQIFYGLTFVFMCLAVLHFYDVHPRIGPLAISIARMMKETRVSLTSFKLV